MNNQRGMARELLKPHAGLSLVRCPYARAASLAIVSGRNRSSHWIRSGWSRPRCRLIRWVRNQLAQLRSVGQVARRDGMFW